MLPSRLLAGHALPRAQLVHKGASPRRFCRVFGLVFLSSAPSGALLVSLWVGGFPLAAFSLPPPLWRFFLLLGGWVPLAVFSLCFPHVSWVGGGCVFCFFFSCYLLHLAPPLACRLSLRSTWSTDPQTPRPPTIACALASCVPYPSPAGS